MKICFSETSPYLFSINLCPPFPSPPSTPTPKYQINEQKFLARSLLFAEFIRKHLQNIWTENIHCKNFFVKRCPNPPSRVKYESKTLSNLKTKFLLALLQVRVLVRMPETAMNFADLINYLRFRTTLPPPLPRLQRICAQSQLD